MTGIAFAATIAAQEAKKVYPVTSTSSPGPTPQATSDEISAPVQELVCEAVRRAKFGCKRCFKRLDFGFAVCRTIVAKEVFIVQNL